ncbi:hypothetical protein M011DRAFT_394213 [Sporormia fimetaria CBS 119925]|uniref:Uncharacterized protein n=1 Tax=Sporormia fimetaria CBS 119925 TaxID=1340428 RepID=A0A6A6VQV4_9PLEO|nr:hypothetical protein M011DRAFT_394213 [Sporormia fimetaria CBS 119925]
MDSALDTPRAETEDVQHTPASDSSSDDAHLVSPTTAAGDVSIVDPLVARCAERIAEAVNNLKRELDQRDGVWATATGTIELSLKTNDTQTYGLTVVQDVDGAEYPITVRPKLKKGKEAATSANGAFSGPAMLETAAAVSSKRTRRDSDAELEKDLVSRKKRKIEEADGGGGEKHEAAAEEEEEGDIFVSKEDMHIFLTKFREDIQDDTSECVNHVQRLLRRFKEEWHDRTKWEDEQGPRLPHSDSHRDSVVGNGTTAFPSARADRDDANISTNDIVREEAKLLSSQIRWVEECRRVAASLHDKREDNWRSSSASFHDRNRQDRENFQNRMLHESATQGRMLSDILNEVKAIGLYAQSMKWETPGSISTHPVYPPPPMTHAPAFPTQSPPTPARGRGSRGGRR